MRSAARFAVFSLRLVRRIVLTPKVLYADGFAGVLMDKLWCALGAFRSMCGRVDNIWMGRDKLRGLFVIASLPPVSVGDG